MRIYKESLNRRSPLPPWEGEPACGRQGLGLPAVGGVRVGIVSTPHPSLSPHLGERDFVGAYVFTYSNAFQPRIQTVMNYSARKMGKVPDNLFSLHFQ